MDKYRFRFNPEDCNKVYFKELLILLNRINPDKERFDRLSRKEIKKLDIKCEHEFNTCNPDEFFFENKTQIILGRFNDTIGCFYKCNKYYYTVAIKPFSVFKNDVFIRYLIDKPYLYINKSRFIGLENVFPIRLLISKINDIPTYVDAKIRDINDYMYDKIRKTYGISKYNRKIINELPDTSILKHLITNEYPLSTIVSRELCILYLLKYYFYIIFNDDGSIKPFVLISKYNRTTIIKLYKSYNKPLPNIKYLY